MNDHLILSDIHLGDDKCRADLVLQILKKYPAKKIIIAGDLFDSHHLSRLRKSHWKVLSRLRKMSKKTKIVYLIGNHCFLKAEFMSILLGFDCRDRYRDWQNGYRDWETDRKSTRLNSSHSRASRMPSSA